MLIPTGRPQFDRWGSGWALRIVVAYAILGTLWIVGSDWAAEQLFGEVATRAAVQTIKGLAYVLGTAVIFWLVLRRAARRLARAERLISDAAWFERAVFDHLPGFVYRCRNDRDWTMEFLSEGCRALTGYAAAELLGNRRLAWADLIHPDDRSTVWRATQAAVGAGEPYQVTYRIRTRDGEDRWVWEQGEATGTGGGGADALHGVIIDITEWKDLEARLQQMQRLEAIGQLTGGIAHDFNNLLSVILANTDLLREELREGASADDLQETVDETRAAAESAATLIAKLAGFSRHAQLQFRGVNLSAAIAQTGQMLRRILPESIEIDLPAGGDALPPARVDTHSLEQILLNLAANSRDAMPHGGRLWIEVERAELDDQDRARYPWIVPGAYVCVTVADNGTGMEPETLERVFDPFFTTKPPGRGTGLGMAMVYGLMKQHGGHVHVYSEPGHGTRTRLYFPVARSADDPGPRPRASLDELPRGSGETVLVVEDDQRLLTTARRVLERLGYQVHTAEDGQRALDLVAEHGDDIDLVLSDLVMPRVGGLDLRSRLLERGWTGGFLLASGYSADEAREQLAESPEILFLRKPWTLKQLAEAVRAALDRRPA